MTDTWRFIVVMLLVITLVTLLPLVAEAQSGRTAQVREEHSGDCSKMKGIKQARCERHELMYEKCHAIRGEAHFVCDSDFIKANPLDCAKLSGAAAEICRAELEAVATCEQRQGREFVRCERETLTARGIGDNDPRY